MNIFSIVKFLGIIAAGYFSYVGLTKKIKDERGNLTKDGQLAKYGIIISCIISIIGFYGDYLKGNQQNVQAVKKELLADKAYNNITYPIENMNLEITYASGKTTFASQFSGILDSIKILAEAIQNNPYYDASLPKKLRVASINQIRPGYEFELDSLGKVKYALLDTFERRDAFTQVAKIAYKAVQSFGFLIDEPDSLQSMDLRNIDFDIAFAVSHRAPIRTVYNVKSDSIERTAFLSLSLVKNKGRISNLVDLSTATCVIPIAMPDFISASIKTEKGYSLIASNIRKINKEYTNSLKGVGSNYLIGKFSFK